MEHHHISSDKAFIKCIDVYLDHDSGQVRIVDTLNTANEITISGADWNQLIDRVRAGKIGKVGR